MSSRAEGRGSIERSLRWTLGVMIVVVVAGLTTAAALVGRESMESYIASRLEHDAEALIARIDTRSRDIDRGLPPVYNQPLSGHYFLVRFEDGGELRSRSLWDHPWEIKTLPPGATVVTMADGPQDQRLLVWRGGYEKQGVAFTVAAAEDISPVVHALWQFLVIGLLAAIIVAVVFLWAQRALLRRGFQRLETVRADLGRLRRGEAVKLQEDVPSEVRPLVREINELIDSWGAHLERSRKALGNLAHALKSPLGLILQHSESDPGAAPVVEQANRMRQLIDRELRRARLAGKSTAGRRFAPRRDLEDMIATIRSLHADKALELDARVEAPAHLPLDQEDMLELLGNLLDNAAKWARHCVRVELVVATDLRITIEDDGPGVAPADAQLIEARGSRLDESVPGHGLGLAIVGDIVRLYGGSLSLDRSQDLGGLAVGVELPLAFVADKASEPTPEVVT
jgi:signal transduction histidine kinase